MLRSLSIKDFVIVDRLELEFSPGLTVLTGETGAGKSILIDALSLVLGERGESGVVRSGCERADISAEFELQHLPDLEAWLVENELSGEEPGTCLLRRVLYADGRSRGFVNGVAATMQQLREVGELLVDIYSQHAHHSLLKTTQQRALLDEYASATTLAEDVEKGWRRWSALQQKRIALESNTAANAEELASLRDQVRELLQVNFNTEEWEALQQEHRRLAHVASLIAGVQQAQDTLDDGDLGTLRQLRAMQHQLGDLLEYDQSLKEALDLLEPAAIQLQELAYVLKRYLQHAELDPERLNEVETRIQTVHATARKYRCRPEDLSDFLEQWQTRMAELEGVSDGGSLAQDEAAAVKEYQVLAQKLSHQRAQAAQQLSQLVSDEMQRLALSGGRFEVALTELAEGGAYGLEQVEFLVSGHAGMEPKPLSKVASGGELSRISLAMRVVTAQQGSTPTMIFDEVDVGIGGSVAEIVGQLLQRLGQSRQVLVITHLPQVAAQGSQHLVVSKTSSGGQTLSHIAALEAPERVEEIARMLGGVEITETTRKHAAEMLGR